MTQAMSPTDHAAQRLAVYLSGLSGPADPPLAARRPEPDLVVCGACETGPHIFRRHAGRVPPLDRRGVLYQSYIRPTQAMVRAVDPDAVFAIYPGDSRSRFAFPAFVKSRLVADRDAPLALLPLDHKRHWRDLAEVDRVDIPFRQKSNRLVWRGATTGAFKTFGGAIPYSARFHVATLPPHPAFDIGYSQIVQITPEHSDHPIEALRPLVRPPLSLAQQLGAKYLLSLEGNDVATGLKWMLHSNSTVIMPPPTCETWACEGELVPFEHYVPVRHDLADLTEVHAWCEANPETCEAIAHNGRAFIARFSDPGVERDLCRSVVGRYLQVTSLNLSFSRWQRLAQLPTRLAARFSPGA